eukprot:COSAG06_NODE_67516_length_251_cov_2.000000_1_plen_36_part_10
MRVQKLVLPDTQHCIGRDRAVREVPAPQTPSQIIID